MKKRSRNRKQNQEISDFNQRFRPFVNRIYMGALIFTGSPQRAEKLQTEIYLDAFLQYLQEGSNSDFRSWLLQIVAGAFSKHGHGSTEPANKESYTKAMDLIAEAC